jgi:hypothetical protein
MHPISMSSLLPCAVSQHLRREYENALRVWGSYEFPQHNAPEQQVHLKREALDARNAASERLTTHREKCRVCKIEERLNDWPGHHRTKAVDLACQPGAAGNSDGDRVTEGRSTRPS